MTAENQRSKFDRKTILDILKGICIIMVVITHYDWSEKQRLMGLFPYLIDMAVPIFLIISGYVLSASYIKAGIAKFEDAYDFSLISKRIIRYTVPFLIAYIIEVIFKFILGDGPSIYSIISRLFTGGYGPGSYYYPIMMQIIFVLPIILFSMYKNPKAGLGFWFIFNAFYELVKTILNLNVDIYRLIIFRYTFLLAFGCYLFLVGKDKIKIQEMILPFIIGIIYIFVTKYMGYETKIINNDWKGTSFLSALYIAPIVFVIITKFAKISFKPLEVIGKASYNIFLTQMVYYYFADGLIMKLTDSIFIHILFNVIICVLVGLLFYTYENKMTTTLIKITATPINKFKSYNNNL